MVEQYDLIVIGAGPGGYVAAEEAAGKGMRTAIIENRDLGGTCLNRGCIPTKTMLHAAELFEEIKECETYGIRASEPSFDWNGFDVYKQDVLGKLRGGISALFKAKKITLYQGSGTIVGSHKVVVKGAEEIELEAKYILIATGSSPAALPIPGAELKGVLNSDDLLDGVSKGFRKLIIIGGGVIGMEFASIYNALGCEVVVVEALDRILATLDKEISQNLKMILKKKGVEIHTGAKVAQLEEHADGMSCTFEVKGEKTTISAEAVLMAVGRRANTNGLFGDGVTIPMDRGRILVNEKYETGVEGIYAIGDVIPGIQLAHTASAQGINAVHIMLGEKPPIHMGMVPSCVYTNPEIGSVGYSVDEAKEADIAIKTSKYPMSANGKSVLTKQERGFIKVVSDAETSKIIGAQMMCARATDMISEFGTAIVNGLTMEQMGSVIRPHPTFCEGISEAVK